MNYINMLFDNGKINKNKIQKYWIEKNIPEYFELLSIYQHQLLFPIDKYSQLIYHYEHNTIDYPKCELCDKKNHRFVGFESGYKLGCSRHCAILLTRPLSNETRKKNTIIKHGVEHTTQLKSVQDKMKNTNLTKYGVEHPSQNNEIKVKIKKTFNDKYGCDLPLQNAEIKKKMIDNNIIKWGVDNPIKSNIIIDKIKKNSLLKYGTEWHISSNIVREKIKNSQREFNLKNIINNYGDVDNIEIINYDNNIVTLNCLKCENNFEITSGLLYQRHIRHNIEICLNCNPLNNRTSSGHIEIINFIESLGVTNIISNNRKIIAPYELDIYLPDYNLAIEFNGIYWHSELYKSKDYHIIKYNKCFTNNIHLMQIWEDDWNYKSDIIKSIISNKLKKNIISIGARKCDIKEVSNLDSKKFLNDNHLQGWSISKYRYGLYYNSELVSLITLSKGRKNLNGDDSHYELVRFCNKLNYNIMGSLSRLWKHFLLNINPDIIISYCDNDLFDGHGYEKLGMTLVSHSNNYWWSDGTNRFNRWNFRKDKLIKEGHDPNKTELEIMSELGWSRCFGSGNKKYIWSKDVKLSY